MSPAQRRPRIGYVGAHLPTYYALEQRVFERAVAGLTRLADALGFELQAIAEPIVTRDEAEAVAAELAAAGAELVLLHHGSFVMGDVVLPFADHGLRLGLWAAAEPTKDGPILLNDFVSMHLHAGVLRRHLHAGPHPERFKWFYGEVDHPWFAPRLAVTVQALRALGGLADARVGWVGGLAPTFLNMSFDERRLRAQLGSEVIAHDLLELVRAAESADADAVAAVAAALRAAGRVEISERDLEGSAALYLALRALAAQGGHQALAVSDWPLLQEALGIHPGLAFSWLDERDGIPVASEGDVLGALSMLLLRHLGGPTMLLDVNDVDLERQAMLMWHCGGSPLSLADDAGVRWVNHSTLGRKTPGAGPMGAVADFRFRRQPVTAARLTADGGELFAFEGGVIESPHAGFDGSRGWVGEFRRDGEPLALADVIDTLVAAGIDHHLALCAGHHEAALREAAAWGGWRLTKLRRYRDHLQPAELE